MRFVAGQSDQSFGRSTPFIIPKHLLPVLYGRAAPFVKREQSNRPLSRPCPDRTFSRTMQVPRGRLLPLQQSRLGSP